VPEVNRAQRLKCDRRNASDVQGATHERNETVLSQTFLQSAAATGGVHTLGGLSSVQPVFSQSALPSPDTSGIEHIVVLMMENRSFDHMLGWLDGADGRQRGLRYADNDGVLHRTYRLAPDFQGCGHAGVRDQL
jgi:phospholipase C